VGNATGPILPELKDLLGHSSLAMVLHYAHLAPEHLRAAVARLDDVLTPAAPSATEAREPSPETTKGLRSPVTPRLDWWAVKTACLP
jgi:hypothetical protein